MGIRLLTMFNRYPPSPTRWDYPHDPYLERYLREEERNEFFDRFWRDEYFGESLRSRRAIRYWDDYYRYRFDPTATRRAFDPLSDFPLPPRYYDPVIGRQPPPPGYFSPIHDRAYDTHIYPRRRIHDNFDLERTKFRDERDKLIKTARNYERRRARRSL
eukprot:TRINITY_DN24581_c0_g1_i1.p1 TRINITY_DN24581_c0_g1~~TRINITY_DN24581_c0_g1_i1.p1  ORF type:complete len:159 (-),score=15.61 TRINITY_DN24581_c0_g1_i1:67-543(-)